jgi:hypothetical protein
LLFVTEQYMRVYIHATQKEERLYVGKGRHCVNLLGTTRLKVFFAQFPAARSVYCTVANIAKAFIAPLHKEKSNILSFKSSLRHWLQFPNLFLAPLPIAVCSK